MIKRGGDRPTTGIPVFLSLLIFSAVLLFPVSASAQIPFGGPITLFSPICQTPPATWIIIGPPTPMGLMYLGTPAFENGPPSHTGQEILGKATAWVPCIIWAPCGFTLCPIVIGGGLMILFNGSST